MLQTELHLIVSMLSGALNRCREVRFILRELSFHFVLVFLRLIAFFPNFVFLLSSLDRQLLSLNSVAFRGPLELLVSPDCCVRCWQSASFVFIVFPLIFRSFSLLFAALLSLVAFDLSSVVSLLSWSFLIVVGSFLGCFRPLIRCSGLVRLVLFLQFVVEMADFGAVASACSEDSASDRAVTMESGSRVDAFGGPQGPDSSVSSVESLPGAASCVGDSGDVVMAESIHGDDDENVPPCRSFRTCHIEDSFDRGR